MDPTAHIVQKFAAECDRARRSTQNQQPSPPPDTAPPPYVDEDSDSEDDDSTPPSSPLKLTINAAHRVQGSNNMVPTSPTALADASKLSAILLHAVTSINNAANFAGGGRRAVKLDLTINCGISVVGDRNVVGNIGLKPKPTAATANAAPVNTVAGAKRKAEEDKESEREAKRPAVADASL